MVDMWLGGSSGIDVANFKVAPEVVGASMAFQSGGRTVEIKLPTDVDKSDNYTCEHWGADGKPFSHNLHRLFLRAELGEQLDLPAKILGMPTSQFEIVPEPQQTRLHALVYGFRLTAETLYNNFLGVVRWKMVNGAFGRPIRNDFRAQTKVIDWASRHPVWGMGGVVKAGFREPVTTEIWTEIEAALQNGGGSPIYFDLLSVRTRSEGHWIKMFAGRAAS